VYQDHHFCYVNPEFKRALGYQTSELLCLGLKDIVRAEMRDIIEQRYEKRIRGEDMPQRYEVIFITKDSKERIFSLSPSVIKFNNKAATLNIARDITERVYIQQRLEASNRFVTSLINNSSDAIIATDMEGKILIFNDAAEKITGYKAEDLLDTRISIRDFMGPGEQKRVSALLNKGSAKAPSRIVGEETTLCALDGYLIPISLSVSYIYKDDNPVATVSIFRDLRPMREVEERLSESEQKYRILVEHTGTAMMIFEDDYTISLANHQAELLTGYSRQEIENKMLWPDIVFEEDVERMRLYHKDRRQMDQSAPSEYEFRLVDKFGNIKDAFLTIGVIPGTRKSIASIMDITQRKRMEEELARTKKLAVLGEMSAHVAHEVRNPLQQIKTGVDLIFMSGKIDQRQKKILDAIKNGIENLESFVTRVLEWTKSGRVRLRRHSINNIINGLIFNYEDKFNAQDIRVDVNFTRDVDRITIDGIQLRQAIENIIDNAIDVMPSGGILKITTHYLPRYPFKGNTGYNEESFTADTLEIRIKDTGCGIPRKELGKVLQPFFTTKTKGTGLGLALVQKVVSIHHGEIEVKSDGKNGAEFVIRVPISREEKS